jgi:molybdate transport system substrate-binding protein
MGRSFKTLGMALLAFVGCAIAVAKPGRAQGVERKLTVFAAASLKTALDGVAAEWTRSTGKTTAISYAASSALAKQIEQDAPADVYISADLDWMDYLASKSLIKPETRVNLLGNRLVLIAPKGQAPTIALKEGVDLAAPLGGGRMAMADVKSVPAGKYGKAALESLGAWTSIERRLAQTENVRAALLLVSRGEAPLGIVYRTDALADPAVTIVATFAAETHPPIIYPMAMTAKSAHPDALAFLAFLKSTTAAQMFETQGYMVLK